MVWYWISVSGWKRQCSCTAMISINCFLALWTSSLSLPFGLSVLVLRVLMKTRFRHDRSFGLFPSLSGAILPDGFGITPSWVSSCETISGNRPEFAGARPDFPGVPRWVVAWGIGTLVQLVKFIIFSMVNTSVCTTTSQECFYRDTISRKIVNQNWRAHPTHETRLFPLDVNPVFPSYGSIWFDFGVTVS